VDSLLQPLAVENVRSALEPFGLSVVVLPDDASTAALAAEALGTTVDRIVKSLLFLAGDEPILVLAAGDRRVDAKMLASELGVAKVRLAKPDQVIALAGYAVGGVPPIAHRTRLRTLIDERLMRHEIVYAAAGAHNAIFAVSPITLSEISSAQLTNATT
jgi:Cys-tRNA(Pro) deacylase